LVYAVCNFLIVLEKREKRKAYRVLVGYPEGERPSEDLDVGGRIILRWILEKEDGALWTGSIWLTIGISGRLL
jgi:hypothetical protein